MFRRSHAAMPRSTTHLAKRLAQSFSKRNLLYVAHVMAPALFGIALSGVAHAQGTMDFSGAQTLMGTFKSRARYAVSSDVEGAKITEGAVTRVNQTIVGLLQSAPEELTTDLQLMATVLQSTIAGVKRQLLESDMPEAQFEVMQRELVLVVRSYVRACIDR